VVLVGRQSFSRVVTPRCLADSAADIARNTPAVLSSASVSKSSLIDVYSRHVFCGGGEIWGIPPQKKLTISPEMAAKLCALGLNIFFGRGNELQKYHGNF